MLKKIVVDLFLFCSFVCNFFEGISTESVTAFASDYKFKNKIGYSADYDSTDDDGFVVNFAANQTEADIDLPLLFIDDNIPEKQEELLIRVGGNDDRITQDLEIVTIIDNDAKGKCEGLNFIRHVIQIF